MPSFKSARAVPHSADKMFDLVADVERYPEFLPLCQSLTVRRRSPLPDGTELLVADMRVGFKAVRESFTSRVVLDRAKLIITSQYLEGPFRSLDNRWTFGDRSEGGSTVEFSITYEFRNRMLGMLMGSMFDSAFRRFAEAFEHRAEQVYR